MNDTHTSASGDAGVTHELLKSIGDAFNNNDIDAVMSFFSADAIFDHAAGADIYGKRFEGADVIRTVFSKLFDNVKSVHWETLDERIVGNKAYCEYRRTAELNTGEKQDFHSIDVLTFKDGLIIHKDTYYKNRAVEPT